MTTVRKAYTKYNKITQGVSTLGFQFRTTDSS